MREMRRVAVPMTQHQREFAWNCLKGQADVVAMGGARGPGKTFAQALVLSLRAAEAPDMLHLALRRILRAADLNLARQLDAMFKLLGWPVGKTLYGQIQWNDKDKTYWFPNGSGIQCGFCRTDTDWEQYQGTEYATVTMMEATQFPEDAYDKIGGSCRSTGNIRALRTLDFNPGGRGHDWVYRRIVDDQTRDRRTVFIPARLKGSAAVLEHDPGYALRVLHPLPPALRKQWEEGDWHVVEGQFWTLGPHIIREVEVPDYAEMHAGVDPGYFPGSFGVVWAAKWMDLDMKPHVHVMADFKKQKLNLREQAERALAIEKRLPFTPRVRWSDPQAWERIVTDTSSSMSTALTWSKHGWKVVAAPKQPRATGWLLMRTLMDDGVLTISPRCMALINEMRSARHSRGSDDMETGAEDHVQDPLRYLLVATMGAYGRRRSASRRFSGLDYAVAPEVLLDSTVWAERDVVNVGGV